MIVPFHKPLKKEDESVLSAKAEKLCALQSQFFANHHDRMYVADSFFSFVFLLFDLDKFGCIYTQEALDLSVKLLEINPECYTARNYRKLVVQHHNLSRFDLDHVAFLFHGELKLTEVMMTHDEETNRFFKHSSVMCVLESRYARSKMNFIKQQTSIEGLDLCDGLDDTLEPRLFHDLDTVFSSDFHNPTFSSVSVFSAGRIKKTIGSYESKIATGAYQKSNMQSARDQIRGFRMSLWDQHIVLLQESFLHSDSEECIRK
ncbi:hypothetical protein RYX36_028319, partial [Vicia faba]